VREDVRASTVQNQIYSKITKDVVVTDKEVDAYYNSHKQNYIQPASRDVRHILVKKKSLADRLYQQLKNGANFAQLAKRYSEDTTSKAQGGKVTLSKGRQDPALDKAAFSLATGAMSKPIKTQYGYYIVKALSAATKQRETPLKEVRPAIRQQLTQQNKQAAMKAWVSQVQKDFASKTTVQVGYAPPATTTSATSTK
jgi:parvulin-like peptidyl-prolyl isomerase